MDSWYGLNSTSDSRRSRCITLRSSFPKSSLLLHKDNPNEATRGEPARHPSMNRGVGDDTNKECCNTPRLTTHPQAAPYDRIMSTCTGDERSATSKSSTSRACMARVSTTRCIWFCKNASIAYRIHHHVSNSPASHQVGRIGKQAQRSMHRPHAWSLTR